MVDTFIIREAVAATDASPFDDGRAAAGTLLELDATGRPGAIDGCYALGSDRRVVAIRWPVHYTGAGKAPRT